MGKVSTFFSEATVLTAAGIALAASDRFARTHYSPSINFRAAGRVGLMFAGASMAANMLMSAIVKKDSAATP